MRTWILPPLGAGVCSELTKLLLGFRYNLFSDHFVWWKALVNLCLFLAYGLFIEWLLRRSKSRTPGASSGIATGSGSGEGHHSP
ncbi:MAG: hypothetical protein MUE60_15250 [Candidatus Eisenbacteria bacterium]|jgi:hypothetical protein|nr:hypothetical protein [Candidatus Eisenbacteria bacterium]